MFIKIFLHRTDKGFRYEIFVPMQNGTAPTIPYEGNWNSKDINNIFTDKYSRKFITTFSSFLILKTLLKIREF